jgi:hypothetical protein
MPISISPPVSNLQINLQLQSLQSKPAIPALLDVYDEELEANWSILLQIDTSTTSRRKAPKAKGLTAMDIKAMMTWADLEFGYGR